MPRQQVETILKLGELAERMHQAVRTVMYDVETSLLNKKLPVIVDTDFLMAYIRDICPDKYHVVSNSDEIAAQELENAELDRQKGLGILVRLPLELRDTIFGYVVAAGHIAITRVSKILNQETSRYLLETGVCRMNFEFSSLYPTMNPGQHIADTIQNISIRVNTRGFVLGDPAPQESDILSKFAGSEIQRKSCCVAFECDHFSSPMINYHILETLKEYTGFEYVEVMIVFIDSDPHEKGFLDFDLERSLQKAYGCVFRELRSCLGHAYSYPVFHGFGWVTKDYIGHDEITRMTFYPRIYWSTDVKSPQIELLQAVKIIV